MAAASPYKDFINRLMLLIGKHPRLITTTLSNIFTMRLIGNKTHGDLAEIAIAEFVNQYMYDFNAEHVGKDRFRAKLQEEDILVTNEMSQVAIPISLKAYGNGPLQISTDKERRMYPLLEQRSDRISAGKIAEIMRHEAFSHVGRMNILPLIYDEDDQQCNIMVFDFSRAVNSVQYAEKEKPGKQRKHPVYKFFDNNGGYIFEVRYGAPPQTRCSAVYGRTQKTRPVFSTASPTAGLIIRITRRSWNFSRMRWSPARPATSGRGRDSQGHLQTQGGELSRCKPRAKRMFFSTRTPACR